MQLIPRQRYLSNLLSARHNGLIKIITGLRRSGKSWLLLKIFRQYLVDSGVLEDHIIKVDLEDRRNRHLREPDALLAHIDKSIKPGGMNYILLDEIQHVAEFEDVLNSFLKVENTDVYVTGSNSKFLSGDIATAFRGRSSQIHVFPLTFSEYVEAVGISPIYVWPEYMTYGGLPQLFSFDTDKEKENYLKELWRTVYVRDIEERYNLRSADGLVELISVLASSIGSLTNPNKLANTFASVGKIKLSNKTITNYLSFLEEVFVCEKAMRYDIKGKKYINSLSKYFFTDIGIRNSILSFRQQEESHIMENIIYNDLRARGFLVDVGIVNKRALDPVGSKIRQQYEVDFVANMGNKRYYIQSALNISDSAKRMQETASLNGIDDSFKKIIVVKDNLKPWRDERGILTLGLFDFLLHENAMDI